MSILLLNHAEVEQLLPMSECIELMATTLAEFSRGQLQQPLRMVFRPDTSAGLMALMPSYRSGNTGTFGLKAICVFPENPSRGKDAHQGCVMLFSGETGEPLALMNASAITAIRTAAVSAVATRTLARADAGDLALIGSGVQARMHLEAMTNVRKIRRARVASRHFANAQAFVETAQAHYKFSIEAVSTVEAAVREADLIVTATTAHEPVIDRSWIAPGAHINAVGTYSPMAREIDSATMATARIVVDRRESALNEAGDYIIAAREGAIGPESIQVELGELLAQEIDTQESLAHKSEVKTGRQSQDEITLFKSLGLAIEDLAAAEFLYAKAKRCGAGTWVEF